MSFTRQKSQVIVALKGLIPPEPTRPSPYNTHLGGIAHNLAANQIAHKNGSTLRKHNQQVLVIQRFIDKVNKTKNTDDIWEIITTEIASLVTERVFYPKDMGGGVNWTKLHQAVETNQFRSDTGSLRVSCLKAIYGQFWVIK